jgi:hypothetical protein
MICACGDPDHIPLSDLDELLKGERLSKKQLEKVFLRVLDRHRNHDVLTGEELTALAGLRDRLTNILNPFTVEQLDKQAAELNAKYPEWEHFYNRSGTIVTWYDRYRDAPAGGGERER